ncbi:MAG: sulfotransferase [Bacteroidia bacterium]|nr:sulfotransferase [Bacteroidia bacterium]
MTGDLYKKPNFFIIGAAKAGTTSLSHYLSAHPNIFISPIKEPHYFSRKEIEPKAIRSIVRKKLEGVDIIKYLEDLKTPTMHNFYFRDWETYRKLYESVSSEKIIGECSTSYLWSKTAAQEIFKTTPNAKILAILRNPVDRAYSHYLMEKRLFAKTDSFEADLRKDKELGDRTWEVFPMYYELGNYYSQLKRYYDIFPAENIKVIIYDDFKEDREGTLLDIYGFLGVRPDENVDLSKEYNRGSVPRNKIAGWALKNSGLKKTLQKSLNYETKELIKRIIYSDTDKEIMPTEIQDALYNYYRPEIDNLQKLIDRDLSYWSQDSHV